MLLLVWETMLGRHVKPGNGRKRKRAVWPPLPHLLGDTGKQETGREGGKKGGWEYGGSVRRERWTLRRGRDRCEAKEAR